MTSKSKSHQAGSGQKTEAKKEEFEFFFGPSPKCTFSQFHSASFTVDGISYNCMEQYMHHQKALTFNDGVRASEIMKTSDPKEQKKLAEEVQNFDKVRWDQKCVDVIKKGILAKYQQNPDIKETLFATYPKILVDASPRDRVWGIGLGKNNPDALNRATWRGKNLMGDTLTDVRNKLMKEEGLISDAERTTSLESSKTSDKSPSQPQTFKDMQSKSKSSPQTGSGSQKEQKTEAKKEEFEFFFGPSPKCTFSQFHPASFTVDGITYNCMEQYMHHQKALTFNDGVRASEIMKTSDPKEQKKLAEEVQNFDKVRWDQKCVDVIKKGILAKYQQNPDIKETLFATYPKILVDASPRDRVWGIGLGKNNPDALNRATWRGKNLMGDTLTDVRNKLMKEEGLISDAERTTSLESSKTSDKSPSQPQTFKDMQSKSKSSPQTGSGSQKEQKTEAKKEEFEFFFGPSPKCTFSQFHPASFTVDGITYNCMEQYMHHQKALTFNDEVRASKIMKTSDLRLGEEVQNFDKVRWDQKCVDVIKKGILAKYRQNPDVKETLFATYPKTLVDASPRDRVWGIGLGRNNPDALSRATWRGKNLLGDTLTDVRNKLMKEEGLIPDAESTKSEHELTPSKQRKTESKSEETSSQKIKRETKKEETSTRKRKTDSGRAEFLIKKSKI